jgi:hypothetical protein
VDAVRHARIINRLQPEESPSYSIPAEEAWRYLRVDAGKANLAPVSVATWRKLASVRLPNGDFDSGAEGDDVGVVEAWEPPPKGETTRDERAAILQAMAGATWRASYRAEGWIGEAFAKALELDPEKDRKAILARIRTALSAGWLVEVDGVNAWRRPTKFVRVASREDLIG